MRIGGQEMFLRLCIIMILPKRLKYVMVCCIILGSCSVILENLEYSICVDYIVINKLINYLFFHHRDVRGPEPYLHFFSIQIAHSFQEHKDRITAC
jgi:hypothetical protein